MPTVLKFQCPNGHQLSAPPTLAGKQGKCPKCNAPFTVPAAETAAAEAPADSDEGRQTPEPGSGPTAALGDIFVFLCPNGHKLNGPPSMKGKPGQCPHCGARFRIPSDDDLEVPEEEPASESSEEQIVPRPTDSGGFLFDFGRFGRTEQIVESQPAEPVLPSPPPGSAALGYIISQLWNLRDDNTELEIYLTEGEIMSPDFFHESLSSSDFGVFAVQEGDGTFAITVIPWSSVRRVGLRKVESLPDLFR